MVADKIICADVLDGLKQIDSESISLVFTSPPYGVGIKYNNHNDNMPYQDYLDWMRKIFVECKRVLRKGGRVAINIDAVTNRQEDKDKEYVRCIYAHFYNIMKEIGLFFRTEICWYKQNAVGKATAWGSYVSSSNPVIRRNHEYILVWSKNSWILEGDKELSDMTKEEFEKYTLSTWFIQPEKSKLGGHPAPFPQELAKRVIKLFSYRGDTILDPFSGSGTTCYMAKKLGRKYIGIDNSQEYCKFAGERIKSLDDIVFDDPDYIPRSVRLGKVKKEKREELF